MREMSEGDFRFHLQTCRGIELINEYNVLISILKSNLMGIIIFRHPYPSLSLLATVTNTRISLRHRCRHRYRSLRSSLLSSLSLTSLGTEKASFQVKPEGTLSLAT